MPLSPRPLSLFSSLKLRASKQNVGGASSAREPPTISAPITVTDTMPPSSMSRMQQYARSGSLDSGIPIGTSSTRSPPAQQRADTPQVFTTSPPNATSRQAIADAAKLPLPKPSTGRYVGSHLRQPSQSSLPQPQPAPLHSPPHPPHASPPMRRARTNSQDRGGAVWPAETSLGSPFTSPGSLAESGRHERYNDRRDDHVRSPPRNLERSKRASEELSPFIIGKDGLMTVLAPHPGPSATTINTSVQSGTLAESAMLQDYQRDSSYPPSNSHRANLPIHTAKLRRSYIEHQGRYKEDDEMISSSPTYESARNGFERRMKKEERALEPQRSTLFQEDFEVSGSLHTDYPCSEEDIGTPRASTRKQKPKEKILLESSIPVVMSSRMDQTTRKRRRNSCDYDDNALTAMRYSELREQSFDIDPTKAVFQPSTSVGASLPEKLRHYQSQRESDQNQFFTQMAVADWERSGDWFLEQFGAVTQRLREARQAKRTMVEKFETEIGNREEAVRLRAENINKKLEKIKHKGEDMLADKDI